LTKESEYYDKKVNSHEQKRVPSGEIQGTVFYNIHGELEFKGKSTIYLRTTSCSCLYVWRWSKVQTCRIPGMEEKWPILKFISDINHKIMLEPHTVNVLKKQSDNNTPV